MNTHEIIQLAQKTFENARIAESNLPLTDSYQLTRDCLWNIMSNCLTIQRLIYTSELSALEQYGIALHD